MVTGTVLGIGISLWLSLTVVGMTLLAYHRWSGSDNSEAGDDWRYSVDAFDNVE